MADGVDDHAVDALRYMVSTPSNGDTFREMCEHRPRLRTAAEQMRVHESFKRSRHASSMLEEAVLERIEKMQLDAMHQTLMQPPKPVIMNKPLDEISNAELVMEMIKRGFAVMKLPENGQPPETLRGKTDSI